MTIKELISKLEEMKTNDKFNDETVVMLYSMDDDVDEYFEPIKVIHTPNYRNKDILLLSL